MAWSGGRSSGLKGIVCVVGVGWGDGGGMDGGQDKWRGGEM